MTQLQDRPTTETRRILLIEDDDLLREVLGVRLREAGYQVEVAANGRIALDLLEYAGYSPDLIVTDLKMPEVDGFGVIERVRELPTLAHLPIVIISSLSRPEEQARALRHDIARYLVKPIRAVDVLAAVADVLVWRPGEKAQ